jgi:antitoxin HigA-1
MTLYPAKRSERQPTHPGAILREDVLPALGMKINAAAVHLGITRQQLHRILAEKSGVSPEMAVRLGKFCGNGADLWLSMQQAYDLFHARKKLARDIGKIHTFTTAAGSV